MRRTALRILVASVAASALVGIVVLLTSEGGESGLKVLGTTLCVSGASMLATACIPAWEQGRLMPVPPATLAIALLGMTFSVVILWAEPEGLTPVRIATTLVVLAVAGAHASYLAVADLAPRHAWVRHGAHATTGFVAVLVLVMLWGGEGGPPELRALGVGALLLMALTTLVLVLPRMAPRPLEEARHCPGCGLPLPTPGAGPCPACGASFRVTFTPR